MLRIIAVLTERNTRLEAEVAAYRRMVLGARSERSAVILSDQGCLNLGDAGDAPSVPSGANDNTGMAEDVCVKQDGGRRPARRNVGALPPALPRIERVVEPVETACPCCNGVLHRIGEDVSEALDIVPAVVRVLRTIRPKYGCRACEGTVLQAPAPARVVTGGMASTALVAHVVSACYGWHLPLYRQCQM
ncbi:hypothetical protein C0V82_26100 (plasmid) [Niveispirillum cyanobacteriorum]|uniref:IS66 family transposase n=1 Tax=Niveispirillum cyanobacteriorum TaxID=1612173 RepID=A0A2K9NLH9_9PROT|nr:hypothetical protein C0V82_26100 [Niveispirillum cyanobacteriorum]